MRRYLYIPTVDSRSNKGFQRHTWMIESVSNFQHHYSCQNTSKPQSFRSLVSQIAIFSQTILSLSTSIFLSALSNSIKLITIAILEMGFFLTAQYSLSHYERGTPSIANGVFSILNRKGKNNCWN